MDARGPSHKDMKKSLERRILIFSLLALTLTIAVNTGFNVESFRRSYRDGILQRAQTFSVALKNQVEAVVLLGLPLDEIDGVSERCQEIVNNDHEISYCLIEDYSGTILYHNREHPQTADVIYVGSLSPEVSILESKTMGKIYDHATLLYDYDDKVVGRARIGFQDKILNQLVIDHLVSTVLVLIAAFIAAFAMIVIFIRYDLLLPIRRLCGMAEELADGRFETRAPQLNTRELDMLGNTMTGLAKSLQERDEELSRNYQELESTNLELKTSYEQLANISSELGRSREMYRSLLDDASDAILVCDEGDNLVIANKAAEVFFGQPKALMENTNYFSFLESIKCHNLEEQFENHRLAQPLKSTESNLRFWRSSDQSFILGKATNSVVVSKSNRLIQIVIHDATKEEAIRQNLERTATEMERLNQMKNSFLGLASHELKTPLTIIMGYVELLLSEREEPFDEDTLGLIRHISSASDRLSEIVRDMVDVSLIDGHTIDLISQDVDVNILVQRAVDKAEAHIEQREQNLKLELSSDLPPVRCDVDRMIQALGNILGNAIKFSPDRGTIIIQTKLVHTPRKPEKFASGGIDGACNLSNGQVPYVEISICDKGIGIAETEQDAIFDKFHEVGDVAEHSSGKVAFQSRGAGLGLSIVKGIVDLHGGAVWVESPGHDPDRMPGSTFYVLLPAIDPNA
ncbi:MAG: PAS domain S-box protein [Deltaproteobacteria bacterium]|nr:MAG: PAS domain S-box protein [Deltaproteobacteria bacterium]